MKNKGEKAALAVQKVIIAVTLFFSLIIFLGTIGLEEMNVFTGIFSPVMRVILLIFLTGTIYLALVFLYHLVDDWTRCQRIIASVVLFGIMALIFVVMLVNFECVPFTDALNVQDTALYFAETGEILSEDSPHAVYYGQYGNNNLMTILFAWFFKILRYLGIESVYLPLSVLAALGILIAALFTFLIGVRIGGLSKGVKVLILCVLNPLYYLLVLWVYSTVLSIPFMMGVLYFGICAYQTQKAGNRILYSILTICFTVIGYYIRPTVLIPIIAVLCCGVLLVIKGKKIIRKYFPGAAAGLLVGLLLFEGIGALNESYFSKVSSKNFPITHWVMVSSHGNAQNNNNDTDFTRSFETKDEKRKATIEKTIENYQSYSLPELAVFMGEKVVMNWSHGDGGDLYTRFSQDTKNTSLYSWVLGDRADFVKLYCFAFWLNMVFLMMVSLWRMMKSQKMISYSFLFALTFFGGILFYLFWEIKGSYSLPFLYIMLLLASDGEEYTSEKMIAFRRKPHKKSTPIAATVMMICSLFLFRFSFYTMTHTDISLHHWSVQSSDALDSTERISYEDSLLLTQEFYAFKPFDTIVMAAKANKAAVSENVACQFRLLDEAGEELFKGEVFAEDISKDGMIMIPTGEIIPDGEEEYIIEVESEDGYANQIRFLQRDNAYLDMYKGTLRVNGEARQNDLWLQVYQISEIPWCSTLIGVLINGGWFLLLALLLLWTWNPKNIFNQNKEIERKE